MLASVQSTAPTAPGAKYVLFCVNSSGGPILPTVTVEGTTSFDMPAALGVAGNLSIATGTSIRFEFTAYGEAIYIGSTSASVFWTIKRAKG